jgi:hypothetical protein
MLELYATGRDSVRVLAKTLRGEGFGIRGPNNRIPSSGVHKMLRNPL